MTKNKLKVSFDAMVVRQLGDELITDPEQAILELVKNSYDADSKSCTIKIDSTLKNSSFISISDKGHGMSRADIEKGWLTISYSEKRGFKEEKKTTETFGRAYQGDKGLGRLSAMKLGHIVRITTKKKGYEPVCVEIDWRDFYEGQDVTEVPIKEIPVQMDKIGTTIEILELFDKDRWSGIRAAQKVKAKLSSLISPFNFKTNFKVYLNINDAKHDLDTLTDEILAFSTSKLDYDFDGENLKAAGRMKLSSFLRSQEDNSDGSSTHYESWLKYLKSDKGSEFFKILSKKRGILDAYDISLCSEDEDAAANDEPWFIKFKIDYPWNEIKRESSVKIKKPGNFSSSWYQLVRQGLALTKNELTSKKLNAETREVMNSLVGIGVYKSGFRVGNNSNSDWLGLSKDATSGRGFYSLRPENVIGYIKFDDYEGESLRETSDRQGFVEDETYTGFIKLTETMKSFANDFINLARKEFLKFIKDRERKEIESTDSASSSSSNDFVSAVNRLNTVKNSYKETKSSVGRDFKETKSLIDTLDSEAQKSSDYDKYSGLIDKIREDIEKYLAEIDSKNNILAQVLTSADRVLEEIEEYSDRLDQFYESAAVGLSAESLAHDINPFLDEIQSEIRKIKSVKLGDRSIKTAVTRSSNVISYLTSLLSREISIINPMLRTKRRVLSSFSLEEGVKDFFELKNPVLERNGIAVDVKTDGSLWEG